MYFDGIHSRDASQIITRIGGSIAAENQVFFQTVGCSQIGFTAYRQCLSARLRKS